jgi:hypothetical protein
MRTNYFRNCLETKKRHALPVTLAFVLLFLTLVAASHGEPKIDTGALLIGTSTVDITPPLPVALDGQMGLRIATRAETPLTANIIILERRTEDPSADATVFVSCDLVTIPRALTELIRQSVARKIPTLDTKKIIVNATHTHTAGAVREGWYKIPPQVTQVKNYHEFLSRKIADAIVKAWNARQPGTVTWGMSHAKVAYNRRAVYADGSAKMYGETNISDFRMIEGYEDQSINSLFFWDGKKELIAVCINVASPAQVVETRSSVHADYWHPVRAQLRKEFGKDLCVVAWIGAAGDQTPRPMYDHLAEKRMVALRNSKKISHEFVPDDFRTDEYLDEIAGRIVTAVLETYAAVKDDRFEKLAYQHLVRDFDLPMRRVTAEEYLDSIEKRDEVMRDPEQSVQFSRLIAWYDEAVKRYEHQKEIKNPVYPVEVHVLRLGDIVICTNPFELYTAFGIQIKSRSKALQTFSIQLAGPGTYVPTADAMKGGHYSAVVQSNLVGPEGGQMLVDRTIAMINRLWNE